MGGEAGSAKIGLPVLSMTEKLKRRRDRLQAESDQIARVILILAKQPEVQEIFDILSKLDLVGDFRY